MSWNRRVKAAELLGCQDIIYFEVLHPKVLQRTNKYYMSVSNTTFILYTGVQKRLNPFFYFFISRCPVCGEWCKFHWLNFWKRYNLFRTPCTIVYMSGPDIYTIVYKINVGLLNEVWYLFVRNYLVEPRLNIFVSL